VLEPSDFESGGLNRPSHIRPNRLFTADSRIVLCATGRVRQNELREAGDAAVAILHANWRSAAIPFAAARYVVRRGEYLFSTSSNFAAPAGVLAPLVRICLLFHRCPYIT
jgi:hypothetical protein